MEKEFKYIGKRIDRSDARDKILGKTKYTGDLMRYNMLYGKLLTSEKAHAKVHINTSKTKLIDGIVEVFTYEDVPKKYYNSNQWFPGSRDKEDELILHKTARHVGDRIALVLGESMDAVERALSSITVEYEELPAVIGIDAAKKDAVKVTGDTNLCFEKHFSCGDIEKGFEKADYIIEDTGTTQKIHHAAIETHACVSEIDTFGNLIIYSHCQDVFQIQHVVSQALEYPYDNIRVIKQTMGGSFGGKGMPVLEPICAFATLKTGRPVKIIMDRKSSMITTRTRNASFQRIKTGITKEGKIVAREIEINYDGGAYVTNAAAISAASGKKVFRTYNIENQRYVGKTYYTNTVPGGVCRGYGSPQIHAITEINISNAASRIGMDPVDFRILNAFDPEEYEEGAVDQIGMPAIGNARIKDCLIEGREHFNWDERKKAIRNKNTKRFAYGLGVAASAHGNGYHGSFPDYINVTMQIMPDSRVLVKMSIHDMGCGTILTMQQIAAEVLDIPPELINVPQADTHISPPDSAGTQASRVTFVCGGAVKEASELLKKKMIEIFSNSFDCEAKDVQLKDGVIGSEGTEPMSYGSFATYCDSHFETTLKVDIEYKSKANPGVYSVVFVEAKVDKYLGLVDIEDILVVQDVGQVINRTLAEGQIQGGAQMSLGMALYEDVVHDDKGNVKSDGLAKYHIINAPSMPDIKILFIEKGDPMGPFGAKSIGEMAAVAPAPALINAVNDALGTNITDYPATPERIIKAINSTNAKEA